MWFKNLQVYRFTKPFALDAAELAEKLEADGFKPCDSQQLTSSGWTAPLGRHGEDLVHAANGYIMICNKRQDKLLPAAVINEELEEKVIELEDAQDRKVSRKERKDLKDEITFNLLPKAFSRSSLLFAYISEKDNLMIINSSSLKRADEMIADLRQSIGSLPLIPLTCQSDTLASMTQWLSDGHASHGFELGSECELRFNTDISRVVRCKNQDLTADEILNHLKTGMHVSKLELSWKERIEFVLDEKLTIKRLRFTDVVQEKAENQGEDVASQFDVDFAIMTLELAEFVASLVDALGGEQAREVKTDNDVVEEEALEAEPA